MPHWEYQIVTETHNERNAETAWGKFKTNMDKLGKNGEEGWELVNSHHYQTNHSTGCSHQFVLIFKRVVKNINPKNK